jgi:hypothetical protein
LGFKRRYSLRGLRILIDFLQRHYDPGHEVVIYEAALYPQCQPRIKRLSLTRVPESGVTPISTLYIPPKAPAKLDLDMAERLGIRVPTLLETRARQKPANSRLRSGDPEADGIRAVRRPPSKNRGRTQT